MLSLFHTASSQNGSDNANSYLWRWIPAIAIATWFILFVGSAEAATSKFDHKLRSSETHKVELSALSDLTEPKLDWRNPGFDLYFETPTSDWIDDIEIFLRVHAEGRPNTSAQILVTFNNAKPVPLRPRGQSFEARLKLDKSKVKSHSNKIRISFAAAGDCVNNADGAWTIDLDDSLMVLKASTPSRPYYLRDLKQLLQSPLTTPSSVSLSVHGPQNLKLEMLAAQGIALNMPDLPEFSLRSGTSDLELHMGLRSDMRSILRGTELQTTKGPVIGITRNAPTRLILTGDTDAELMDLAKTFARSELPPTRRPFANPGEFLWQDGFKAIHKSIQGKTPISELGNLGFNRGWGNSEKTINFNVDDPLSTDAKLDLEFLKGVKIASTSTVNVSLNGSSLGVIDLTERRNKASFDLPRGALWGNQNALTIAPELAPNNPQNSCASQLDTPGFALSDRSRLNIQTSASRFEGDLTRFASSGYPFSSNDGVNTTIVMATTTRKDRAAALQILAKLGKAYGSGWTNASVIAKSDSTAHRSGNVLFIGPNVHDLAPRSLSAAIDGRPSAPKIVQTAGLMASDMTFLSVREHAIIKGGIAGLFPSEQDNVQITGFITSARGQNFSRAVRALVKPGHWNRLQGSMAHWNQDKVAMTKTAFSLKPIVADGTAKRGFGLNLPNPGDMASLRLEFLPAISRLDTAGGETANGIVSIWSGLPALLKNAVKRPDPEPIKIVASQAHTPKLTQTTPIRTPAPLALKAAPKINYEFVAPVTPQYVPGASLGIEASSPPKITSPKALAQGTSIAFAKVGNWIGGFIDRSQSGLFKDQAQTGGKANMLVFATLLTVMLILLTLARPKAARTRSR